VIGRHVDADVNDKGRLVLQLCCNDALCIMNIFFQDRDVRKHTWCRDSLGQRSLSDFCTVPVDLFRSVQDARVKTGPGLSTDHHLMICNLHLEHRFEKTTERAQTCWTWRSHLIKSEARKDKNLRNNFGNNISELFQELLECTAEMK